MKILNVNFTFNTIGEKLSDELSTLKELQKLGVILRKNYKHTVSNDPPELSQHDAHVWRARIVCPVKNIEIPPKFKRGKRV